MKAVNFVKRNGKFAILTAPLALAGQAMAAVPAEVTTELATAKTDAVLVGGIVLGVIVSIFALQLIRRVLR